MSDENRMSQSDMLAWRLEQDPMLRSIVVVVFLLDASPDWDRFVPTIERMTHALPALRRKLVPDRGIAPPQWVDDEDFDINWHVRRLGIAGSRDLNAVLDFARTAGMTAFDPARPMWEYTVLDGLRRDAHAAIVMKFHHSLTDGVGAVKIAAEVMDLEARRHQAPGRNRDGGTESGGVAARQRALACGHGVQVGAPHRVHEHQARHPVRHAAAVDDAGGRGDVVRGGQVRAADPGHRVTGDDRTQHPAPVRDHARYRPRTCREPATRAAAR